MLVDFQSLIFELYTNQNARAALYSNPESIFSNYDLGEKEREALRRMPKNNLERFAKSLSERRKNIAERILAKNPDAVVVSSFYVSGPAIFVKKDILQIETISDHVYQILKKLNGGARVRSLINSLHTRSEINFSDVLSLAKIIFKYNALGKSFKYL